MTIAIAGLGLVGTALASRLLAHGYAVAGFDTKANACERFSARFPQAKVLVSNLELRQFEVVFTAVLRTSDVEQIVEGLELEANEPFSTRFLVDCSTGDSNALARLGSKLKAQGIALFEAPLSGSSEQIEQGQATMLLGTNSENLAPINALLNAISTHRIVTGKLGSATNAKLATNLVLGLNRAALAEGMAFAEKLGIERQQFLDLVLATPARSEAAVQKGQSMVDKNYAPQSRIHQHLKDVETMLSCAKSGGYELPLSRAHAIALVDAIARGNGDLDNAAIVETITATRLG